MSDVTPLEEKLYEVGWYNGGSLDEKVSLVFKWMEQASEEIARLQGQVGRLEADVARLEDG